MNSNLARLDCEDTVCLRSLEESPMLCTTSLLCLLSSTRRDLFRSDRIPWMEAAGVVDDPISLTLGGELSSDLPNCDTDFVLNDIDVMSFPYAVSLCVPSSEIFDRKLNAATLRR